MYASFSSTTKFLLSPKHTRESLIPSYRGLGSFFSPFLARGENNRATRVIAAVFWQSNYAMFDAGLLLRRVEKKLEIDVPKIC